MGHHSLHDRAAGEDYVGAAFVEAGQLFALGKRHRAELEQRADDFIVRQVMAVHELRVILLEAEGDCRDR